MADSTKIIPTTLPRSLTKPARLIPPTGLNPQAKPSPGLSCRIMIEANSDSPQMIDWFNEHIIPQLGTVTFRVIHGGRILIGGTPLTT